MPGSSRLFFHLILSCLQVIPENKIAVFTHKEIQHTEHDRKKGGGQGES